MNFYRDDRHLQATLKRHLDPDFYSWADKELEEFGSLCAGEIDQRAVHTDREGQPKLIKYDRMGNDISHVWVNDGYRETVRQTYNRGIVGFVHKPIPQLGRKGNYIYSYAQGYLLSMAEPGFYCPVTLSMATAYLIDRYADQPLKNRFLPHVLSTGETELYEGATFLTERQGGSDVGANDTKAVKDGNHYRLYGEKYFASNAGMCGVAAVLARMEDAPGGTKGLSLFLVPWKNEDGANNALSIRRLKDKLGVRAVPSAEVVFDGAEAYLIGEADRGFYYMMEALNLSRVSNAVASLGIMRRAFIEARQYAFEREAFGSKLAGYPMVKQTLVELTARQEVQTSAVFNLISLFDRVMTRPDEVSPDDKALNRLLIALTKKRTAEEAISFSHEAIELHGGNGFIEDFVTPRLLRDAQVLTVWEGTANILGLEVLRLIKKYAVHRTFANQMEQELVGLPRTLEKETALVNTQLEKLRKAVSALSSQPEDVQTYHSKRIADLMTDIYYAVTALKDAAVMGSRQEIIAKVLIGSLWTEDIIDSSLLPLRHFDDIINSPAAETV
ncbi:acyl-CoA dehydrogenase family protein [Bacillus marinisedimentorum]|uniref:acyl-CoA dehydrogenase family protein n=1 Tax=Bacillus marinisedimentorum TaxID=1821260 RepID=UPI000873420F|nr:acyl-CoA dehydrogenase family protein [Bacillus marinisedimentorum]